MNLKDPSDFYVPMTSAGPINVDFVPISAYPISSEQGDNVGDLKTNKNALDVTMYVNEWVT